jgi:hypothetical protein
MTDVIRSYINDGIGLIQLAGLLIVGVVVLTTWAKTKSVMTTIGTMVVGALVLGYLYNADWFGRKAAEDIQNRDNGSGPVAAVYDPSAPKLG